MTIDSGAGRERVVVAGIGGEINTRDTHAVILAFYPGSHVRPKAEGTARSRSPKPIYCALRKVSQR